MPFPAFEIGAGDDDASDLLDKCALEKEMVS